jgi:hypothetical protein
VIRISRETQRISLEFLDFQIDQRLKEEIARIREIVKIKEANWQRKKEELKAKKEEENIARQRLEVEVDSSFRFQLVGTRTRSNRQSSLNQSCRRSM